MVSAARDLEQEKGEKILVPIMAQIQPRRSPRKAQPDTGVSADEGMGYFELVSPSPFNY
jgi:hypothetical protein